MPQSLLPCKAGLRTQVTRSKSEISEDLPSSPAAVVVGDLPSPGLTPGDRAFINPLYNHPQVG